MKQCIDIYQCGECLENKSIVPKHVERFFDEKKLFLAVLVIALGAIAAGWAL